MLHFVSGYATLSSVVDCYILIQVSVVSWDVLGLRVSETGLDKV